ncbi:hypothetical protein QBC34DRAFT_490283 [Podospora aff. communis PSN243]|uniref:DUF7735 domain-containing protein n=1 Tax=Podospora aff. communis PSN243 TaxID=3040156 RepID=A0AAV9H454_9PEZI|nr:hypothetical protein QBC34DRAFT_490283 [Podospora aff. communis PSN243]
MKTSIAAALYLTLAVSAAVTETHITAAEWAVPTANNDPYTCPLRSIPHYLTAAPSPTGALQSALHSYEASLYAACSSTRTISSAGRYQPCPVPPRSTLCAFSSAIPTPLLPEYSSYASSAASWWSEGNGDQVVSLVKDCPWLWYQHLIRNPGKGLNLNRTVAHAQCWAEAHPTGAGSTTTRKASGSSGVPGSFIIPTATQTPKPAGVGGVSGRGEAVSEDWIMDGSGLGMAAMGALIRLGNSGLRLAATCGILLQAKPLHVSLVTNPASSFTR